MKGHTQELLCKFLHCVKDHPESKTFDTQEMVRVSRRDRVSIFSDFDRGEVEKFRGSILVDFRYFSLFLIIFRAVCAMNTRGSAQNRSELFSAKIRQPVAPEKAVHMCETLQICGYRSLAGGAARGFNNFYYFLELNHFTEIPISPSSLI